MRESNLMRKPLLIIPALWVVLTLMHCEPGKALNPGTKEVTPKDTGKIAKIVVVSSPSSVLPGDTGTISISITDSAAATALKGAKVSITSTRFSILSASTGRAFSLDSVPDDGKISFGITSTSSGTGTVNVRVSSGSLSRSVSITVIVTDRPVAPRIDEKLPPSLKANDTTSVSFQVLDSTSGKPISNAVVTVTSANFSVFSPTTKDTMSFDTTGDDGKALFRILSKNPGSAGALSVNVKTAAGVVRTVTYTLSVAPDSTSDRPRKMVFTAIRSTLRADGTDSTQLQVLVKDDNNNPLQGEKIRFISTGGVIQAEATTNPWGEALTTLKSERVNKSVVVTATLEKTGATAQQTVSFDGVTLSINAQKRVLMSDSIDALTIELRDGGGVPMSGDSVEIVAVNAYKGFAQLGRDSLLIVTDTRGQYKTNITSHEAKDVYITARALGAKDVDTVTYTTNTLTLSSSKTSIPGDGVSQDVMTATLKDGAGKDINGAELRWTTTFGTFATKPFSLTSGGQGSINLVSSLGSGLAFVNVEAYTKSGATRSLLASGTITIPVTALRVSRLVLKVTPDNIPVKIGESRLIAQAFDSSDNVMTGVLVGFKLVKGAGGGDEVINPPVDYTQSGQAEAVLKAGGVISLYRGVKIAAVALDINGTDTSVIASSDTLGLTISGPPYRVSVGVNILKGINPNDGTFGLPGAAVVTDVNGNLVADGTPVNFSVTPIAGHYPGLSWRTSNLWPYYILGEDTVWYDLPWTDYNNNGKLDQGEEPSPWDPTGKHPARGEDLDGNGVVNIAPETFIDLNGNGVWDSTDAEPLVPVPPTDTSHTLIWVDFNKDGIRQTMEPFYRNGQLITDLSRGPCKCTGQRDLNGDLYEASHSGSPYNHPFPGDVSVGVTRQVLTSGGKALNTIIYTQTSARIVSVRLTAESNGIRASVDAPLPIVQSDK